MKLSDVVACISETTGLSKRAAHDVICKYQNMMRDALKAGEKVSLEGIGTIEVAEQAARKCRNMRTGEAIDVPAKKRVRFKCSSMLKDSLNKA